MTQLYPLLIPCLLLLAKEEQGRKSCQRITSKGYCSTKNIYYYGSKLYLFEQKRTGKIPFAEIIALTDASENDLSDFKRKCMPYLNGKVMLEDKIYSDFAFFTEECPTKMFTP